VRKPLRTRPTLKDVAREASVSLSTVSYVLNNNSHAERITEATKQRVRAAVHRLGYQSNPIGRALQRGYTNQVILLIVTWDLATSHAATAMAISRAAIGQGFELTVHVADDDATAEAFLKRRMLHNSGGILVIWDSPAMQESFLKQLAAEDVPVIDLLSDSPAGISTVTADREDAFLRGTRHLLELGHRRIGVICDAIARSKTTLRKLAGYRRALAEAGLPYDEKLIENVREFGFEGGYHGFSRLSERCADVTGVLCINDPMALGAIAAVAGHGRSCPADVSVIGFGDLPEGRYFRPRLTTFVLSANRVAEQAMELVLRHRQTDVLEPQTILIPVGFVVRDSTAAAPRSVSSP
jgi:DNA-binding LacI/PurR family transcriptional regulator